MKKLSLTLAVFLIASQTYASPIATFSSEVTTTQTVESTESTNFQVDTTELPADTLEELQLMKSIYESLYGVQTLSTRIYNPNLTISSTEYTRLYNERMTRHNNGTNPLPVRYLPLDYDNNMTVADASGLDKTVMYEIVLGYPIFYKINRYSRPETFTNLQNLPTTNSDKLDVSKLGLNTKIGNLYLN